MVGARSIARTQVVKTEKSVSVAPLPTTSARPNRQARVSSVSGSAADKLGIKTRNFERRRRMGGPAQELTSSQIFQLRV